MVGSLLPSACLSVVLPLSDTQLTASCVLLLFEVVNLHSHLPSQLRSWSFHNTYVEGENTFHFTFDVWQFPIHKFSNEYVCFFFLGDGSMVLTSSIGLHTNPTFET